MEAFTSAIQETIREMGKGIVEAIESLGESGVDKEAMNSELDYGEPGDL